MGASALTQAPHNVSRRSGSRAVRANARCRATLAPVSTSSHTPTAPHGRIVAYDALRVFAIVTVVAIHTLMPYRDVLPPDAPVRVFDDVLHYAVPLFVFISGALLWSRPWPKAPATYRRFLQRRTVTIALPYLAWATVFSALYVLRAGDALGASRELPGLVATGHVWYHLYFVPMLLTFYLLTPVASRLAQRSPEALLVLAYALRLLGGAAITGLARDVGGTLAWQYATHIVIHLPHMALGAWFALRLPLFRAWVSHLWLPLLTAGLTVNIAVSLGAFAPLPARVRNPIIAAGMAITVLGIVLKAIEREPLYERWSSAITRAGSLAFGVYFVHPLFLLAIDGVIALADAETIWLAWPWLPAVVWLMVTWTSFAAAGLLAQRPATAWLVGLTSRER